ncbi:hypothetical protein EOS_41140 [Caballeronia mineralivorans PML1(12)]|uniref:Uncharacterized protein n=1 Tax=Caballeronia mineralivorans PML1(12) TaxID=908627 RepID=A0A0J1CIL5_9BURK|nr:hypothetical protein [Caballeronia mineralivorans]KLU20512.1 hypothetical protein EOS_41140 [Caballeronia mineralivorans PML1(12)]
MHQWQGKVWIPPSADLELRNVRRADGELIDSVTWETLRPRDQISLVLLDESAGPTGEVVNGAFEEMRRRFPEWHLAGWHDRLMD